MKWDVMMHVRNHLVCLFSVRMMMLVCIFGNLYNLKMEYMEKREGEERRVVGGVLARFLWKAPTINSN